MDIVPDSRLELPFLSDKFASDRGRNKPAHRPAYFDVISKNVAPPEDHVAARVEGQRGLTAAKLDDGLYPGQSAGLGREVHDGDVGLCKGLHRRGADVTPPLPRFQIRHFV